MYLPFFTFIDNMVFGNVYSAFLGNTVRIVLYKMRTQGLEILIITLGTLESEYPYNKNSIFRESANFDYVITLCTKVVKRKVNKLNFDAGLKEISMT